MSFGHNKKAGERPAFLRRLEIYFESGTALGADLLLFFAFFAFLVVLARFSALGASADVVLEVSAGCAAAAVNVTAANSAAMTAEISCFIVSSF
jgi:hypothetical protein